MYGTYIHSYSEQTFQTNHISYHLLTDPFSKVDMIMTGPNDSSLAMVM